MSTVKVAISPRLKEWGRSDPTKLNRGIRAGTALLVPRVVTSVKDKFKASGVPNGPYLNSITGKTYDRGMGYISSKDERKLKTWLERGTRGGKKTARKGAYGWRAGKALVKAENKAKYYDDAVAKALNS